MTGQFFAKLTDIKFFWKRPVQPFSNFLGTDKTDRARNGSTDTAVWIDSSQGFDVAWNVMVGE